VDDLRHSERPLQRDLFRRGVHPSEADEGLAKLGFTMSYTYFTWKNGAPELRAYLEELTQSPVVEYFRGNLFANTPDILNEYLVKGGRPAFRVRLLLAGTLLPSYDIYSGFELCENVPVQEGSEEYLDSEKVQIRPRDYCASGNIKRRHPSAQQCAARAACAPAIRQPLDLLTGARYTWRGARNYVRLDPAVQPGHLLRVERGTVSSRVIQKSGSPLTSGKTLL
jgi:starch synthase (maltosyl-transferring)